VSADSTTPARLDSENVHSEGRDSRSLPLSMPPSDPSIIQYLEPAQNSVDGQAGSDEYHDFESPSLENRCGGSSASRLVITDFQRITEAAEEPCDLTWRISGERSA
jgi:hypothetical protein